MKTTCNKHKQVEILHEKIKGVEGRGCLTLRYCVSPLLFRVPFRFACCSKILKHTERRKQMPEAREAEITCKIIGGDKKKREVQGEQRDLQPGVGHLNAPDILPL